MKLRRFDLVRCSDGSLRMNGTAEGEYTYFADHSQSLSRCEQRVKALTEALKAIGPLPCTGTRPNDYGDVCGVTYTCANCKANAVARQALADGSQGEKG